VFICFHCDQPIHNDSDDFAIDVLGIPTHIQCERRRQEDGPTDMEINGPTYPGVNGCPHGHLIPRVGPDTCAYCSGTE